MSSPAPAGELLIREPSSHDDLRALYELRLIQGQEMAHAPVNPFKVANRLLDAACRPETHTMLMAILDGQLVGYLLLERRTYDYSDFEFLIDFGFYVLPQHRGGDVGPELLRFARDLAEIEELRALHRNPQPLASPWSPDRRGEGRFHHRLCSTRRISSLRQGVT